MNDRHMLLYVIKYAFYMTFWIKIEIFLIVYYCIFRYFYSFKEYFTMLNAIFNMYILSNFKLSRTFSYDYSSRTKLTTYTNSTLQSLTATPAAYLRQKEDIFLKYFNNNLLVHFKIKFTLIRIYIIIIVY